MSGSLALLLSGSSDPMHLMSKQDEARYFHKGIELFNNQEWFDAHEEWEEIWHIADGPRKLFYQGLIQVSVTLEHAKRGNPRGVRCVHETCLTKFVDLPDQYMGVDVRRLLDELETAVRPVLDLPAMYFDPARGRRQDIPFDPTIAPKIDLAYDPFADDAGDPDDADHLTP